MSSHDLYGKNNCIDVHDMKQGAELFIPAKLSLSFSQHTVHFRFVMAME